MVSMPPAALDITDAVAAILAEADADIAARKPVCRASGRCCKFEEYGHRLYVTAAEMAYFEKHETRGLKHETRNAKHETDGAARAVVSLTQFFASDAPRGCPYQVDGLCTAREARPLGCRLYFCDENAQSWQNAVYEKYHAKLQALHQQFGLPYRYLEWRAALRELTQGG
jgi:Fe-S-cluster containining protein